MIARLIYLLIAITLIFIDKLITYETLIIAKKRFRKRYLDLEKNPLQKYFFKFGITKGLFIYSFVSFISFFISSWLLSFPVGLISSKSFLYSFIIIYLLYIVAIFNNLRWFNVYKNYGKVQSKR